MLKGSDKIYIIEITGKTFSGLISFPSIKYQVKIELIIINGVIQSIIN